MKTVKESLAIFEGNPLQPQGVDIYFETSPGNDSNEYLEKTFNANCLVSVDSTSGKFIFEDRGTKIILTKIKEKHFDYYSAF